MQFVLNQFILPKKELNMNDLELNNFRTQIDGLLEIYNQYAPFTPDGNVVIEAIKPCITEMANQIIKDKSECAALLDKLDETDFWTAPASSKFHANYKGGLAAHSLMVIKQALIFAKPFIENFQDCPGKNNYTVTAEDVFVSALSHDFCKTNFYGVEYRNTKDITGNWIKQPFYKTKAENRNLGHGNESVLQLVEVMPSFIKNRNVLEAISRHMGFSDLSESESYNYSLFLQNPLVILLQMADQTAAQWFNC